MKIRSLGATIVRCSLVVLLLLPTTGCPRKKIVFELTPATMLFTADEGGPQPADQILTMTGIKKIPEGGVQWTAVTDQPWLTLTPNSGVLYRRQGLPLTIQADHTALPAGTYTGQITVIATYHNHQYYQTYEVTLEVTSNQSPSEESTFH